MADQNKDSKKPPKVEKAPAPPPVKTVSRAKRAAKAAPEETGAFPIAAAGTAPPAEAAKADPKTEPQGEARADPKTEPKAQPGGAAKPQTPTKAAPHKPERRKPKVENEQARLKKEEQARRSRRLNRQFIGLAVAILVLVGAVSIVMNGIEMAQRMFDDSGDVEIYQNRFKAFVWFDMLPFDSVSLVDENSIKQVVIWSIFDDQGDSLERNENGEALIPASEVDSYGADIFGPNFRFSGHGYFWDHVFDLEYNYDANTQMYIMPTTSLSPNYLPTVMEVVREPGGVRRVVMGYVSAINNENQVMATPDYDHPVRYMDYMLRRDGSGYYLYAIQNNITYAAASSSSESAVAAAESQPGLGLEDPLLTDGPAVTSDPVEVASTPAEEEPASEQDAGESQDSSAADAA